MSNLTDNLFTVQDIDGERQTLNIAHLIRIGQDRGIISLHVLGNSVEGAVSIETRLTYAEVMVQLAAKPPKWGPRHLIAAADTIADSKKAGDDLAAKITTELAKLGITKEAIDTQIEEAMEPGPGNVEGRIDLPSCFNEADRDEAIDRLAEQVMGAASDGQSYQVILTLTEIPADEVSDNPNGASS